MHIDSFSTADHLPKKRRSYDAVKEAVLAAGRFSTFEASDDPATFTKLVHDPEVEVDHLIGYPWIGVRRKVQP